jgi:hypothetical protein
MDPQRFDAIRAATLARLAAGAEDLAGVDDRGLTMLLTREATDQFYDDNATRAHEWEYVERTVQRALADFRRGQLTTP